MEWYAVVGIVLMLIVCFLIGYFAGKRKRKEDDGVVILTENKVEVIFRDTYEGLSKKKYVNLKMQS